MARLFPNPFAQTVSAVARRRLAPRAKPSRAHALLFLFCLIAVADAADPAAPPPLADWLTRTWTTADGLPQDSVTAVVQTRDGFLWVGGSAGLTRFDGVRFRKFGLQDGLRSVYITALAEDRAGALWIGTSGGGVSRWAAGRITSFGPAEGFPAGLEIIALAAGRDGSVWIGTEKGLVQLAGGAFKFLGEAEGLPRGQIRALLEDSQGTLWVSAMTEGLFRGTKGQFTSVAKETDPIRRGDPPPVGGNGVPRGVYSLCEARDGTIWAGSGSLWKWSNGTWQKFDEESGLPGSAIQCLAQASDGALWIATRAHGLYRSTGDRFALAGKDGPLASQSVRSVVADREGSIWVGSGVALHRLSPRLLQFWGVDAGLAPTTPVTSVVEDPSGILVGTATKGMFRFGDARFTPLDDPNVPSSQIIYCTATTSDGAVWAAGNQFLARFHPTLPPLEFKGTVLDTVLPAEAIRALCADGETLWAGTYASTLLRCDAAGFEVVAPRGAFPGTITSIVREAAGVLWIGTSAGLHRWERGALKTWTERDGLLTAYIRALHRDADGTLWIGTLGGGLARMRNGQFVHFTSRNGLIDDVISQILPDDFGALWLGCNRGLMRLERKELDALAEGKISTLNPRVFDRNEGMLKEQCYGGSSPSAFKARDGRLFFPTLDGLAEIDPRRLQNLTTFAPQAGIDEILVDQQRHVPGAPLIIPPGNHRLEIAYTAPALRGGEWLRFRRRLDGIDRDWIDAGSDRVASYDGLASGHYAFHLAVADAAGRWTESPTVFAFTVQPFFWQTPWFRVLAAMLAIGLNGAAVWWYSHRKHRRQFQEFERERRQQADLAHAGRVALLGELSASLAHELKQPLTAILSNAQAAIRFLNHDSPDLSEVREILKDIASEDQRAGEIIGRMRAMMKKGEAQMELRDINADVQQALQLIRSDLVARNVLITTDFSPDLPPVRGDHIQLQQVLLNLVINGCDAMQDNPPPERRILIETSIDDPGHIRVSVSDRGPGIAPDQIERIFQPFYSTKSTGLGMGLAICQAIVNSHGGRLWAAKNPDHGVTFHFTLKVSAQA